MRLVQYDRLDPRKANEAAERPIVGAVNIPLSELPRRTHELPRRSCLIRVVGPPALARETVCWLLANGRQATVAEAQEDGPQGEAPLAAIGRLWEPTAFLEEVLPQLRPGAALDLACGTGRDAVSMSSCGWTVTAVDALPDALERARDLAARYAPDSALIRWVQADLEGAPPAFEHPFDLITVFRFLHRPLFEHLWTWLKPGGSLLCETFTTSHRERHGKPMRAAHVLSPRELRTLASGYEIRHYSEEWRGTAHTARLWATKRDSS